MPVTSAALAIAWLMFATPCFVLAQEAAVTVSEADEEKPAGPTDGVLSVDRAWDYRPYRVRTWICTDGAPAVNANLDRLMEGLERRSSWQTQADGSCWFRVLQIHGVFDCLRLSVDPIRTLLRDLADS